MIYLATRIEEGVNVNIRELASEIDSPVPYTAKIMQSLSRQKFVSSYKGPNGGFFLTKEQSKVPLIDIVNVIDGMESLDSCGLGLRYCSETHPCPIHADFGPIRDSLRNLLSKNTIIGLANDLQAGNTLLKRL